MSNVENILDNLKERGYRASLARKGIMDALRTSAKPLSVSDICALLKKVKVRFNKTTVYRELAMLAKEKVVLELRFDDQGRRYEIMPEHHHHHLVCLGCEKVEEVVLEKDLDSEEKHIARAKQFNVLNHSLEFYGMCRGCQPVAQRV